MDVKEILLSLGYSNITEDSRNYRMKPLYRDSSSNTVLSVRKDTGYFIDFSRNIKGSLQDLVQLSLKLESVNDAEKWLSNTSYSSERKEAVVKPTLKQIKTFNKECLLKLSKDHSYWINRGVSEDTVSVFEGGVVGVGKMKDRYIFPIYNYKKELVGVSGRSIVDRNPKWKHIGVKSEWKYPLQINNKILRSEKQVILVESIGDMLALWDCGIKNTMVTFGLEVSVAVISYLLRIDIDHIFIAFNNDEQKSSAGNQAAEKACAKLARHFDPEQIHVAIPEGSCDFGEMTKEEILSWKKKYYQLQEPSF